MNKLKLDLETVEVLSFPTTAAPDPQLGTVLGAMITNTICGPTCRGTSVCCETV